MESTAALENVAAPTGVSTKETSEAWKDVLRAIRELTEGNQETKRNLDRLEKTVDRVTRNIGGLNNSIGEIVEMIIIPGVKEKMNLLEHNFNIASPRKEFSDFDGSTLMEVDLLLENCNEVMAVEVKTQVSRRWVDRHLKRLELLREKEKITGMSGKTIYAAVAGITFDDDARALAVENGMYLIEIEEESERIKIIPPKTAKKW
jgi:predicted DNA-binding transcriptional regulator AlpA